MATQGKQVDPRSAEAGHHPPFPKQEQAPHGSEAQMEPRPDYGRETYQGFGRLKDRVALVTGGDSGIGRAVSLAFAREGADVAFVYLDADEDADETVEAVQESGRKALKIKADLRRDDECKRIVAEVVERFGRIDVLVNNAAKQGKAVEKFEELTPERIEDTFRTNILAMFSLVRHALPHMRPGATIVNVGSIQAYEPSAEILDYASTKGAIVTFTKGLSQSLLQRGIRVNCVAPGPVWTPLIVQSFPADKVATFGKQSPMERPAQPVELAPAFVFLASDESRYITGEVLGVTGGKPLP